MNEKGLTIYVGLVSPSQVQYFQKVLINNIERLLKVTFKLMFLLLLVCYVASCIWETRPYQLGSKANSIAVQLSNYFIIL